MCDFAVNIRAICVSYINNFTEAVCDGLSPDVASHVYSSPPWVLTKSTCILVPCKHICKLSCLHLQRHIVLTQNEFFWLQKPTKLYYYYYKCHGLECCQSHSCGGTGLAAVYTTRHDQPHFLLLNTLGHKDRHSGSKQYKIALSSLIFFVFSMLKTVDGMLVVGLAATIHAVERRHHWLLPSSCVTAASMVNVCGTNCRKNSIAATHSR